MMLFLLVSAYATTKTVTSHRVTCPFHVLHNRTLLAYSYLHEQVIGKLPGGLELGSTADVRELQRVLVHQTSILPLFPPPNVCEIGFNAGHSAVIYLLNHPTARVLSFDLGATAASRPASKKLQELFPGRLQMIWGNSMRTVPKFIESRRARFKCDLIFVDGGHSLDAAAHDIGNMMELAAKEHVLIVDDTNCEVPGYCHGPRSAMLLHQDVLNIRREYSVLNGFRGFTVATYKFTAPPVQAFWLDYTAIYSMQRCHDLLELLPRFEMAINQLLMSLEKGISTTNDDDLVQTAVEALRQRQVDSKVVCLPALMVNEVTMNLYILLRDRDRGKTMFLALAEQFHYLRVVMPWHKLNQDGWIYPLFAPLQPLCESLELDEPVVAHVDPIFAIYENLAGFDYRVCARRFVDSGIEGPDACLASNQLMWPHGMFEDLALQAHHCNPDCTIALAFARVARCSLVPADAAFAFRSAQRILGRHEPQHFGFWPTALDDLRSFCTLMQTAPLFPLLAFLGRKTAVFRPVLRRIQLRKPQTPVEGCAKHLPGSEYISGWPPKQRSTSKEALDIYNLIHVLTAVLDKHNVHWWADAGTLLGAKRHLGLMPQECDVDFALWRTDVRQFAPGSPVLLDLATFGIRIFNMVFYMAFRACFVQPSSLEDTPMTSSLLGCIEPYVDFHTAEVVFGEQTKWKYSHFPDARVSRHAFSLDGLLEVKPSGEVIQDLRVRWPFGDTFVYVARNGSIAAESSDYLDKVYGTDCMVTMRQRDPPKRDGVATSTDRPFVHRFNSASAFYGMVAGPVGPLRDVSEI